MFMRISIGIAVFAASSSVSAADWLHVFDASKGAVYVDSSGIRRTPSGYATYWTKTLYSTPQDMGDGERVDTIVRKKELDCVGQRERTLASRWYLSDAHVWGDDWLGDWSAITPGSNGEVVMEVVCSSANSRAAE